MCSYSRGFAIYFVLRIAAFCAIKSSMIDAGIHRAMPYAESVTGVKAKGVCSGVQSSIELFIAPVRSKA